MELLKKAKNAAKSALGLGAPETAAGDPPPLVRYLAKMNKPNKLQQAWVFWQTDEAAAIAYAKAAVAPGGWWYGWTIWNLYLLNMPYAPNTLIPMPPDEPEPPEEPAPDVDGAPESLDPGGGTL